jgi:hypothetical protein
MKRKLILLICGSFALIIASAFVLAKTRPAAGVSGSAVGVVAPVVFDGGFEVDILVDGRPLTEYRAHGRSYIEAIAGAEYEIRIRNPRPYRVAVALSVDGLNSIDARRSSAWNASKWVLEPYGTISISGWQMSSERARRFYFTSERDSYGAKLGQTANLGNISAVFFRELPSYPIPVTPGPPRRIYEDDGRDGQRSEPSSAGSADAEDNKSRSGVVSSEGPKQRQPPAAQPLPDDEFAATGIGRSVHNDVRWVNMELDSRPAGEVSLRYEYYPALVRLGILPRRYERIDPLRRREGATGFEGRRFSPEP